MEHGLEAVKHTAGVQACFWISASFDLLFFSLLVVVFRCLSFYLLSYDLFFLPLLVSFLFLSSACLFYFLSQRICFLAIISFILVSLLCLSCYLLSQRICFRAIISFILVSLFCLSFVFSVRYQKRYHAWTFFSFFFLFLLHFSSLRLHTHIALRCGIPFALGFGKEAMRFSDSLFWLHSPFWNLACSSCYSTAWFPMLLLQMGRFKMGGLLFLFLFLLFIIWTASMLFLFCSASPVSWGCIVVLDSTDTEYIVQLYQ
ncbi:hypothetical protein GGI43DRAFT_335285 [Trichoderma evansii]